MRCERFGFPESQGFVSLGFKQFNMPEGLFAPSNASSVALSDAATEALSGIVSGTEPGDSLQGGRTKAGPKLSVVACPDGTRVSDGVGAATMPISSTPPGPFKHYLFLMAGIW